MKSTALKVAGFLVLLLTLLCALVILAGLQLHFVDSHNVAIYAYLLILSFTAGIFMIMQQWKKK